MTVHKKDSYIPSDDFLTILKIVDKPPEYAQGQNPMFLALSPILYTTQGVHAVGLQETEYTPPRDNDHKHPHDIHQQTNSAKDIARPTCKQLLC